MSYTKTIEVYLVTYNRINYLKLALKSILNQTYSEFKLIVLDNCSTDGTEEYMKSLQDDRIQYIRHFQNIGGKENIRYAFDHCKSDYFAVFHDDDILKPNLLKEEIEYLEKNKNCVAVSCLANIIDENGKIIHLIDEKKYSKRSFSGTQFFTEYLNYQSHFIFPATVYRGEFIRRNEININLEVGPCYDVLLYFDIERKGGNIVEIPNVLMDYRIHTNQDSSLHLEKMLVQLIIYLSNDRYYHELLSNDLAGKKKYFYWYYKILLVRLTTKKLNYETADKYLEKMYGTLNLSILNYNILAYILKIVSIFDRIGFWGYKLIKRMRK